MKARRKACGRYDAYMRVRFALVVLLLIALMPSRALAEGAGLCLILRSEESDLFSRLSGQTADLDWEIRVVSADSSAPASPYERAMAAADGTGARVVIWFEPASARSVLVYIADLRSRGLFARQVEAADATAEARSAMLESIAMIVRSSLVALGEGEEIGFTPLPPAAVPELDPDPDPEPEPEPEPDASPDWRVDLAYTLTFDGESEPAQHGPSLRGGLGFGRYWLEASVTLGVPISLSDQLSEVSLAEHQLALGLAFEAARWGPLRLLGGVDVGVALFHRSTMASSPSVTPTAGATTVSALFAPFLRVQLLYPTRGPALGIELGTSLDLVPGAPELRYQVGTTALLRNDLRTYQPSIWLGFVVVSR